MATQILAAGNTDVASSSFTVGEDECVLVSAFTSTGSDLPPGPVLTVQRQDLNGNYITLSTIGYGAVRLMMQCQHVTISMPGTYRVKRPDISMFDVEVGVQTGT